MKAVLGSVFTLQELTDGCTGKQDESGKLRQLAPNKVAALILYCTGCEGDSKQSIEQRVKSYLTTNCSRLRSHKFGEEVRAKFGY